jgi:hypothetical protein
MELRFASVVVRVEVKHGTDPHSGQIPAYLRSLAPGAGAVVLLAPRGILPVLDVAEVPPSVPQRSWQATARAIRRFTHDDKVASWLCDELTTYLFQERLMDPEALRPEHLTALAYYGEAETALAVICQRAAERLHEVLGPPSDVKGRPGIGYLASWSDDGGTWFDWGIRTRNDAVDMPAVHLYAGLSVEHSSAFDPELRHRLEHGIPGVDGAPGETIAFRYWTGRRRRLGRLAQPQDVLVGATLEAQGESLGRWVEHTLRALRAARQSGMPSTASERLL